MSEVPPSDTVASKALWFIRGVVFRSSLRQLLVQSGIVFVLSCLAFSRNSGQLFNGLDGAYMLTNVHYMFKWTSPALGFFANPLQGMSDIWFCFNAWLNPGYVIPYLALGKPTSFGLSYQVAVYAMHALILFYVTVFFGRCFNLSRKTSYLAAWVTILLTFPYFGSPLIYPILALQPNDAMTMAENLLVVASFSLLGKGPVRSQLLIFRDLILIVIMTVLLGQHTIMAPGFAFFFIPLFVFVGIGLLLGAESKGEIIWKLTAAIGVPAILAIIGFAEFGLAIFRYTVQYFFSDLLLNARQQWFFVSILFHRPSFGLVGPVFALTGIGGMAVAAFYAKHRTAWLARSGLGFVLINFTIGCLTIWFDFWHGPSPLYFEMAFWPIYALFGVWLAASSAKVISEYSHRMEGWSATRHSIQRHIAAWSARHRVLATNRIAPSKILPLVLVLGCILFFPTKNIRNFAYPPSRPDIIRQLEDDIGLHLGGPLRGRVAIMPLQNDTKPVSWFDFHAVSARRQLASGNDFQAVGMWHFAIPTVFEYSPLMSPLFFHGATRLLAHPDDQQYRSVIVLRHIDPKALAVLGVTHVLADAEQPSPLLLKTQETLKDGSTIYLYQVPKAVTAWTSPTAIMTATTLDAQLDRLIAADFDPHKNVILDEDDAKEIVSTRLVKADNVDVRLDKDGLRISMNSNGLSMIVLPVLFSRCLTFSLDNALSESIKLVRVNGMETAIVFEKHASGLLRYFTGPFENPGCRMEDADVFGKSLLSKVP